MAMAFQQHLTLIGGPAYQVGSEGWEGLGGLGGRGIRKDSIVGN